MRSCHVRSARPPVYPASYAMVLRSRVDERESGNRVVTKYDNLSYLPLLKCATNAYLDMLRQMRR